MKSDNALTSRFGQQAKEVAAVVRINENRTAVHAALNDMKRDARYYQTGTTYNR